MASILEVCPGVGNRRSRRLDGDDEGIAGRDAGGEHPHPGIGVDDDTRIGELRCGPPHGADEQGGRLRTTLEERADRDPQTMPVDVFVELRCGTPPHVCGQAVHPTAPAVPVGADLAGRHRHPQCRLDAGVEPQPGDEVARAAG